MALDLLTRHWSSIERRWRDSLMAALIPAPGAGLPALDAVDLTGFWSRFYSTAPTHLTLGLRAAVVIVAAVLPWLLGYFRTLPQLDADAREAVLQRAHRLPIFTDLVDIAKIVACLAYFSDPAVEATARGRP